MNFVAPTRRQITKVVDNSRNRWRKYDRNIFDMLSNFAYKMEINYLIFAVVGVLALVFAFITVAFHSLKTARMNPVNSLRSE